MQKDKLNMTERQTGNSKDNKIISAKEVPQRFVKPDEGELWTWNMRRKLIITEKSKDIKSENEALLFRRQKWILWGESKKTGQRIKADNIDFWFSSDSATSSFSIAII